MNYKDYDFTIFINNKSSSRQFGFGSFVCDGYSHWRLDLFIISVAFGKS